MSIYTNQSKGKDSSGTIRYIKPGQKGYDYSNPNNTRPQTGIEGALSQEYQPDQVRTTSTAQQEIAVAQKAAAAKKQADAQAAKEQQLKTTQTVIRQLNESAQRTNSTNEYGLKSDEQGNVYIQKTITEADERGRSSQANSGNSGNSNDRILASPETKETSDFRKDVRSQQERENNFFNSEGLKRVESTANFLTFGNGTPVEQRSTFGKYAEYLVRYAAGAPLYIGGQTAAAIDKSALAFRGIRNPATRSNTLSELRNAAAATPAETLKNVDPRTPQGAAGLTLAALSLKPTGSTIADIEITRTAGRTIETELPGGKSASITEATFDVKRGKEQYTAETRSVGLTKPDADSTFQRTEKAAIEIRKAGDTESAAQSVARTDLQIKQTARGSRAKGTTTQVTNTGDSAVQQSGRTTITTRNLADDNSVSKSYTELGKAVKATPERNADNVHYPTDLGEPVTASGAKARSRKLLELIAPLTPQIAEAAGIEVRAVSEPMVQTLTESRGASVSGKPLLQAAREPGKTQAGITRRTTESGKTIVDVSDKAKVKSGTPYVHELPQASEQIAKTTLRSPTSDTTPLLATQVKTAIESIPSSTENRGTFRTVAVSTKTAEPVQKRTQAQSTQSIPIQTRTTKQETRTETAQISLTRTRSETVPDIGHALRPRSRSQERQESGSIIKPIGATAQSSRQKQEEITEQDTATIQKQQSRSTQTHERPQLYEQRTPKFAPPLKPSSHKQTEEGFAVFVRRKGTFAEVEAAPLTENAALALGKKLVQNTAARSFKIQRTGGRATSTENKSPGLQDFYNSKKERGVFIQKPKNSIRTAGELHEITYKGNAAQRGRRR